MSFWTLGLNALNPALSKGSKGLSRLIPSWIKSFLNPIGQVLFHLQETLGFIAQGKVHWSQVMTQTALIGVDSAAMAIIISTITGSVIALQIAVRFAQTGADAYVGALVALAIIREISPIFTALAVGARAGTAITSEIANMKVTEQIDALQTMRVSPIRYLFVPRLFACVLSLPLLNIIGCICAILSGMVIARNIAHLHFNKYLDSIWLFVKPYDIRVSLLKSLVFGVLLAAICCSLGIMTRGGAREVGLSTTRAAVWTAIAIILADLLLSWIFFSSPFSDG